LLRSTIKMASGFNMQYFHRCNNQYNRPEP